MKLCRTCQRCYEDAVADCRVPGHAALAYARPGPRLIADKYRLDRLLGRGGMGAVYAGTHIELDRPVAVKLLLPDAVTNPQALERFRREARAAAKINHPNVASTYDYGALPDGEAYLTMELVVGQTLREYLQAHGALPAAAAIEITRQIAEGIGAAHHFGVVHRDLKPANIILTHDHRGDVLAKVVDFGIAKLKELTTTSGGGDLTAAGSLIGTPRYMSPEQCAGSEAGPRSDIYSLGVILYEMLTGRPPFDAPTATAIALKHVREPPPDLRTQCPDLAPALTDLVMQALAKDPAARPHTAAEFAARLVAIAPDTTAGLRLHLAVNTVGGEPDTLAPTEAAVSTPNTQPPEAIRTGTVEQALHTDRAGTPTQTEAEPAEPESTPTPAPAQFVEPVNLPPNETVTRIASDGARPAGESPLPVPVAAPNDEQASFASATLSAPAGRRTPLLLLLAGFMFLLGIGLFWLSSSREPAADGRQVAAHTPTPAATSTPAPTTQTASADTPEATPLPPNDERAALQTTLDDWLAATNARALDRVLSFYMPTLDTYYLNRHAGRTTVRADKAQMLAGSVAVQRAGEPQITLSPDGQSATMVFRKPYALEGNGGQRRGEVIQELRWQKTTQGWRIISERDLQVIR